jgi:hypothetical protein
VTIDNYYKTSKFDDISVSSQWPNTEKRNTDARFIDGGYDDAPTLALNLGQYQTRENGDLDTVLEFVVTLDQSSDPHFSAYFRTDSNKEIAPGEYLWSTEKIEKDWLNYSEPITTNI